MKYAIHSAVQNSRRKLPYLLACWAEYADFLLRVERIQNAMHFSALPWHRVQHDLYFKDGRRWPA